MPAFTSLTAPAAIRDFTVPPGMYTRQPRGASTSFFPSALVMQRVNSDLAEHPDPNNPRTDLICLGVLKANAVYTTGTATDSNGGALLPNGSRDSISIETGHIGWFDTGTGANQVTNSMVGTLCFAYDNNTLYATDLSGTLSPAGAVAMVRGDGKVKLKVDPVNLAYLQSARLGGASSANKCRAMVTTLAAYTGSVSGQLTASAAAAFGTQDGVSTLGVGDCVFVPPVIANLTDIGDSGAWEITVLGASGVKWVLTRPSWYMHGVGVGIDRTIDIGPEGTGQYAGKSWRSFAPPATTVDTAFATQDMLWFPRFYRFSQTIGGGGASTTDSAAYIRDVASVVWSNQTSAHVAWASTITAYATGTLGTLGFTGTASDVIKGFALNF